MDTKFYLGIGLAVVLVFFSAAVYSTFSRVPVTSRAVEDREVLYQVSTIDALMLGIYDGVQTVGDIRHRGDFGIGTFDALDGEMIALDGRVYQARADGRISVAPDNLTSPLATVTFFDRDFSITTDRPMNFSEFSRTMEEKLPTANMIYAVRMDGTFPSVKVRAIPAQDKPYPDLTEAALNQSVFTYPDRPGTVVGFYTPAFFKGINVAGFHLHFISDDRTAGGHILDLTIPAGMTVGYDITPGFTMALPTSGGFTGADLSRDLSGELAKVEQ